ncbi:neural cell adhesion molecule 1-like isoform X2 [Petaurus breviceps papuanus]|uniref:neural cell adhesion molecule 1-like isoform X2 n=1 Tax=Petaurus breviceps papuanus TaxID=3040969 RepID=UPI0036DE9A12
MPLRLPLHSSAGLGASFAISGGDTEARLHWLGPDGEEVTLGGSPFSVERIDEASVGLRVTLNEPGQGGPLKWAADTADTGEEEIREIQLRAIERSRIFSLNLSSVVAEEGSFSELQCKVSGIPEPNITWEHQGLVLGDNGRVSVQGGTLTIRDLEPSDGGVYTCEGSIAERMESARENVTLKVTFRPRLEGPKGNVVWTRTDGAGERGADPGAQPLLEGQRPAGSSPGGATYTHLPVHP